MKNLSNTMAGNLNAALLMVLDSMLETKTSRSTVLGNEPMDVPMDKTMGEWSVEELEMGLESPELMEECRRAQKTGPQIRGWHNADAQKKSSVGIRFAKGKSQWLAPMKQKLPLSRETAKLTPTDYCMSMARRLRPETVQLQMVVKQNFFYCEDQVWEMWAVEQQERRQIDAMKLSLPRITPSDDMVPMSAQEAPRVRK